jgi:hypothetical protein
MRKNGMKIPNGKVWAFSLSDFFNQPSNYKLGKHLFLGTRKEKEKTEN